MVNSEAETEFQFSKWIFQSLFAVNINKNNYPWTYLLTWTEPKYVNPFIGFKSFVLICRVCLFSSQSRVLFLSIGWRLIDLQLSFPMHFNWHWNSSSTGVVSMTWPTKVLSEKKCFLRKCPNKEACGSVVLILIRAFTYQLESRKHFHKNHY